MMFNNYFNRKPLPQKFTWDNRMLYLSGAPVTFNELKHAQDRAAEAQRLVVAQAAENISIKKVTNISIPSPVSLIQKKSPMEIENRALSCFPRY